PRRWSDGGGCRIHGRGLHGMAAARAASGARSSPMRVTGVIQAGGKSTRMGGQPKALIELGGRRIIDRVVGVGRAVTYDVLLVTHPPDLYVSLALSMVPDVFPDHGSLGGIYSGLHAASGDAVFTVACDMPFLMPEVARLVIQHAGEADVVVPKVGE